VKPVNNFRIYIYLRKNTAKKAANRLAQTLMNTTKQFTLLDKKLSAKTTILNDEIYGVSL
jgi:hypothetical protein